MSDDAVQTVKRLIALSASDSKEEARTAAFKACELIRKHKLEVQSPGQATAARPGGLRWEDFANPSWGGGANSDPLSDINDFIRDAHRRETASRPQPPLIWENAAPTNEWPPAHVIRCLVDNVECFRCHQRIERYADICSVQVQRRSPYFAVAPQYETLRFHADCYPNRK